MTVIFICSSLEPGRDGVGDYTRRLSGELIRQGYSVGIIALHDGNLQNSTETSIQKDGLTEIKTLRIPARLPWSEKIEKAGEFINAHNPVWLSLQYVPFGFHDKGLPLKLRSVLPILGKHRKWHIMFHELWVGMDNGASLKYKIWGYLQKKSIQNLLKSLSPKVIHTQCSLYKEHLTRLGFKTGYLPLFGNIPIINKTNFYKSQNKLVFVVFGTIHPNVPVHLFTNKLCSFSEKYKKEVFVLFIGRNGPELNNWTNALDTKAIQYVLLNEQPVNEISKILSEANYGVTSNPLLLVEKSGTTIAMIEHGLPVISVSNKWEIPFEVKQSTILDTVYFLDNNFELSEIEYKPIINRLSVTVKELLSSFN